MADKGGIPGSPTHLALVFDGGIATAGSLHFYEYSRAAYAFARFIATIEHFRNTERTLKRVNFNSYEHVTIEAPRKGSFPIEIVVPMGAVIAAHLPTIPIDLLVQYVVHTVKGLLPGDQNKILKVAEIELERQREGTRQFQEITKIVETQNLTMRQALTLAESALNSRDAAYSRADIAPEELRYLVGKLKEESERENRLIESAEKLDKYDPRKFNDLASRVRPQFGEMGLPLRRSATVLYLREEREKRELARLNLDEINYINSRRLEEKSVVLRVRVAAYDVDTGVGRCDLLEEDIRRLPFRTGRLAISSPLRHRITLALDEPEVRVKARIFRDESEKITSLIIEEVVEAQE